MEPKSIQGASPTTPRNYLFDGMRGIAAVAVLLFHLGPLVGLPMSQSGYLAVDFFFILSGYVIRDAYEPRLSTGLAFGRFLEIRFVRLYPLYLAGLGLGVLRVLGAFAMNDPRAPTIDVFGAEALFGLLLLPTPLPLDNVFPLNTPAWSLSLEVIINVLFAAWLFRLPNRVLALLAAAGAAMFTVGAVRAGSLQIGIEWSDYYAGAGRAIFGFLVGVLLARADRKTAARRLPAIAALPIIAALVLSLVVAPGPGLRLWFDLATVLVLYPVLVLLAARVSVDGPVARAFGFLGDLSYPLYATHYPLLLPLSLVTAKLGVSQGLSALAITAICLSLALLAALADTRIRGAISRALHLRRSARTQVV